MATIQVASLGVVRGQLPKRLLGYFAIPVFTAMSRPS
jgi:hypothetical protein